MIETLNEVDGNRKCFRMVGGVLVERTVKEVLPSLENNKEKASLQFAICNFNNFKWFSFDNRFYN